MTLDAFVSEAGRALGEGRSLYGPAPVGAGFNSATSLDNARVRVDSAVAESGGQFNGQAGDGYRGQARGSTQALDATSRADQGTGAGVAEGGAQARQGRSGADGVVDDARRGVAAIAPATNTQAGKVEMVNHLQERLMQMRGRLLQSEQRNIALAQIAMSAVSGFEEELVFTGIPVALFALSRWPAMTAAVALNVLARSILHLYYTEHATTLWWVGWVGIWSGAALVIGLLVTRLAQSRGMPAARCVLSYALTTAAAHSLFNLVGFGVELLVVGGLTVVIIGCGLVLPKRRNPLWWLEARTRPHVSVEVD
jgi:hypothetical protein